MSEKELGTCSLCNEAMLRSESEVVLLTCSGKGCDGKGCDKEQPYHALCLQDLFKSRGFKPKDVEQ